MARLTRCDPVSTTGVQIELLARCRQRCAFPDGDSATVEQGQAIEGIAPVAVRHAVLVGLRHDFAEVAAGLRHVPPGGRDGRSRRGIRIPGLAERVIRKDRAAGGGAHRMRGQSPSPSRENSLPSRLLRL